MIPHLAGNKISPDRPPRPALRWYGGAFLKAEWAISHFPPHAGYHEGFGGAASILLAKTRARLEVYNELDDRATNFFEVVRDRRDELIEKLYFTPWSRSEYHKCRDSLSYGDKVEQARRFFVSAWMGVNGSTSENSSRTGFRSRRDPLAGNPTRDITHHALLQVSERLRGVVIENVDYKETSEKYDHEQTLHLLDPPYLKDTRSVKKSYRFEWSEDDHRQLHDFTKSLQGYIVLFGYRSTLYEKLFEADGWQRFDREFTTNGKKKIDSLWLSPRTFAAVEKELTRPKQPALL